MADNDFVNFGEGVIVRGDRNVIRDNRVTSANGDGIAVDAGATRTQVVGNAASGARDDGIEVDAPGTLIKRNTANDNGDLGIEAVAGVVDGGGNLASGNRNPLQCLNVACG